MYIAKKAEVQQNEKENRNGTHENVCDEEDNLSTTENIPISDTPSKVPDSRQEVRHVLKKTKKVDRPKEKVLSCIYVN